MLKKQHCKNCEVSCSFNKQLLCRFYFSAVFYVFASTQKDDRNANGGEKTFPDSEKGKK